MTGLPHPPLDERLRQNFEHIQNSIVDRYIYFEFTSLSSGLVFTLPKDAIILFGTIVFVTNPFDTGVRVKVGEIDDSGSVFSAFVDRGGKVPEIIVGNLDSNITDRQLPINIGFDKTVTKGSGWFVIHYLLRGRL